MADRRKQTRGGKKLDHTIDLDDSDDNDVTDRNFVTACMDTPTVTSTPNVTVNRTAVFGEVQDEFCDDNDDDVNPDSAISSSKDLVNHDEASKVDEQNSSNGRSSDATDGDDSHLDEDIEVESDADHHDFKRPDINWNNLKLPKTCTVLETKHGARVFLVGTAHFSKDSQRDVVEVIEAVRPDVVFLELCRSRMNILLLDEEKILSESSNLTMQSIRNTIKEQGTVQGVMYLLMLSMAASLTRTLGMAPGGEFRAAYKAGQRIPGCSIWLGDRPVAITMKRAMAALTPFQKLKMGVNILFSNNDITQEEVEKLKNRDLLESMLEELAGSYPGLTKVFVDERDTYLAHSLSQSTNAPKDGSPPVVVGVVGIGHCAGIERLWGKVTSAEAAAVCKIPRTSRTSKIISATIKVSFLSLAAYGIWRVVRKYV